MPQSIYVPPDYGSRGFFPAGSSTDAYGNSISKDQFGRPLTPTFISPGSTFGAFPGQPLVTPTAPVGTAENPFTTLNNVKSPNIQSGIDAILARAKTLTFDPNTNTYVTRENVKSQPVQKAVSGALDRFGLDVNDSRMSLKDFTSKFLAGDAEARANQQQESAAINRVYDPNGLQADLAGNARDQQVNLRENLNRALATAGRSNNQSRMLRGDSSYLDQQFADTIAGGVANENTANSRLQRDNILELANRRQGAAGTRNRLLDELLSRGLVPLQAAQTLYGNEVSRLGSLTSTNNANNFYTLDSQEQQAAQQAQLMAMIQQMNNQNNFYGLSQPRNEDLSGLQLPSYNMPLPRYPNVSQPNGGGNLNPWLNPWGGAPMEPSFGDNVLKTATPRYNPNPWDGAGSGEDIRGLIPQEYTRNFDGTYDLPNNFNYNDPNNPRSLYIPGWTPQTGVNPYE